ncbi:E3 ubiquitin-protein ligase HECW2-like [Ornithodoros turicata]|uniref:E3 ubiquitin-protein ligase HECW2-like n=1 Tax=Ornithodoros turicata TaxID=34597 RepID=UPI003139F107
MLAEGGPPRGLAQRLVPRQRQRLPALQGRSSLSVSRTHYVLGRPEPPLLLSWDIREDVAPGDWIGLYRTDETDPLRFLEHKNKPCLSGNSKGQVLWNIDCQDAFTSETTNVCFRYYHGTSGILRAVSPVVTVCRSADITGTVNGHASDIIVGYSSQQIPTEMVKFYLTNLHGRNLKKGMFFNPEPYVKMCIQPGLGDGVLLLPHHGQVCRTGPAEATVNPSWMGQFEFIAYPSDMLEFEVKDKFARSRPLVSRFLGRLGVHIWDLLEHTSGSGPVELSYNLANKSPSDHVSGQIFFTFVLEHGPVDPWTHIRQVHNPIYVSDIPDRCCSSPPPPPPPSSSPEPPPPPPSPTPPPPPQQPPVTTARTTSLPGNANPPSTSSSSSSCSSASGTDYPEPNPRRKSVRSNSEHGLHSPAAAAPQAAARRLSQTPRPSQGAAAQPGTAFANLEYILQGGRTSQAGIDLPPPLPPKQKGAKHRPLERLHALGSADEVPSTSWKHARRRQQEPPECEPPAPSDSDDSSASASPIAGDSSPPPTLPRRTRPVVLHVGTDGSRPAPLATPEQDSLHEIGGAPSSLENLSGVLDALESEDEVSAAEESVQECDRVNSEPANVEFDSRGLRNSSSPAASSSEEASTLSASEDEDSALRRRHPSEQRCHSDSECSLAKPRRQHNRHSRNQGRLRAHGQREAACSGVLMPYSRSDHSSLVLTTARECTLGSPEGDRPPPVVHVRRIQPPSLSDSYTNGAGLIGGECSSLASCSATSSGPSTVEPSPTSSGVTPGGQQQHVSTTRLPSIPERTIRYQRVELDEPLPSHWEARIDSHGRIFYIDHLNRTTTWNRPSATQSTASGPSNELQRQQFDRRYQSIRRTMTARLAAPVVASAPPAAEEVVPTAPPPMPSPDGQRSLLRSPAVRFVTRSDFFNVLHMNDDALAAYNRSSSLKHMIAKIRRDSSNFERYQHNRDLVSLLNKFADKARDLPRGWETKLDRCGKQFFIDHTSRSTTFIDPRLPVDVPYVNPSKLVVPLVRRRSRSAGEDKTARTGAGGVGARGGPVPPPRPPSSTSGAAMASATPVPTAYNDKVVAFLRQPNILDILRERHPAITSNAGLRDRVHCIRAEGTSALGRLSHDLDLTILLSLFEQEIMSYVPAQYTGSGSSHRSPRDSPQPSPQASPGLQRANVRAPAPYRRDFEAKLRNFYRKLESKGYGQGPSKLKLNIRRDHLLEDAFMKIMAASKKDLQKSRLYIGFAGEEGLDYGGPSREFFFLLSRELFNPYYGLFEYSANDTYTVQVSPMSAFVDNQHEWFRFSGRVLGLALVHQYLLDAFFTRPFYKALLRLPCSLSDLEYLDAEFHQSLLWLKENDITDMGLELTFSVVEDVAGHVLEKELKPGGKGVAVTERNKKEYIERMLKWRLERGVSEQTESLVRGFYEVVDSRLVAVFDARELELVIAGTAEIDIADWRKNTEYRSGYHDSHPVIQWFWMAIERFDNERRLRLLQFVTGTSSIPYEGFAALRGSNGPRRFCVEKWGKPTSLPRAHTCFNRLDLPPYMSFDMLYEKLLLAVEESSTFGIE